MAASAGKPVGDSPLLAGNGSEGFLYLPFHLLLGWPAAVPALVITIVAQVVTLASQESLASSVVSILAESLTTP